MTSPTARAPTSVTADAAPSTEFSLGPESAPGGEFVRQPSRFRDWVSADGSSGFAAAPGRYQLYMSTACPWSHRTTIVRELKGLGEIVGLSLLDPVRDARGWAFTGGRYSDDVNGWRFLSEAYSATDPAFADHVSAPVLWDRETGRIVNNESADIIRMFNSAFDELGATPLDLYPEQLRGEIDALNVRVYARVNNGVYRSGFARSQAAYEAAFRALFEALDELERRLAGRRFLLGDRITEADWRLFVTLVRFDAVYYGHFKCNLRRLLDYPNLFGYTRELYRQPGIAATVELDAIKRHYYMTHPMINPSRIVPLGPAIDFLAPHGRG